MTSHNIPKLRKEIKRKLNDEIINILNKNIDEMNEYFPAHSFYCQLTLYLTGQSCSIKKYFSEEMNDSKLLLNEQTNYGDISVRSIIQISSCNSNVITALKELGFDPNKLEEYEKVLKNRIVCDTSGIKSNQKVIEKKNEYLDILKEAINECNVNVNVNEREVIIKQIAARKHLLKHLYPYKSKYVKSYNKVKKEFNDACIKGNFPRNYEYNGVMLYWEEPYVNLSYIQKINMILQDYDLENNTVKFEEFKLKIQEISFKNPKYTLRYTLDDYDYINDESI